jgi:polyphosphate glucokinase
MNRARTGGGPVDRQSIRGRVVPMHVERPLKTLCFDIGGTGIKAVVVNPLGKPLGAIGRIKTPRLRSPAAILGVMRRLAGRQGNFDRISVGLPAAVCNGIVKSAPNLPESWHHMNATRLFEAQFGKPVRVANDADLQGFGAIAGRGVEILITLGTGVGSALFVEGRLVPNVELGREKLADAARKRIGHNRWQRRVVKFVRKLDAIFSFDHLHLGGGNAADLPPVVRSA